MVRTENQRTQEAHWSGTQTAGKENREDMRGGMKIMLPIIDMIKTGENITYLRRREGLRVRDLQEYFGFATPQAIYKWQHGAALPSIDNLAALAQLFHVHMEDVLVFQDEVETRKSA